MFIPNILFTIIFSLIILILHDKIKIRMLFGPIFALLLVISAMVTMMDWSIIGPVIVLLYYKLRNENVRRIAPSIVAGVFMLISSLMAIFGIQQSGPEIMMAQMGGLSMYGDINYWIVSTTFIIGCISAGLLLKCFNGERGKRMKWTFYIAYPLHLAVLGLIALALGLVSIYGFLQV